MEKFRYSAISTAHTCLRKFKLQYVDKLEVKGKPSIDLEFGTAIHTGVQAYLEGEDGLVVFQQYWDTLIDVDLEAGQRNWQTLRDLGTVYMLKFKRLHLKHFDDAYAIEEKIDALIGGFKVEGTPDYVGLYRGKISIVDFKTSNYSYRKEKIVINEQMPIYSALVKQVYGHEVEQIVYLVFNKRDGSIQTHIQPLTKKILDNALENATMVMKDLTQRTEFPKNPNSCTMGPNYTCPYFEVCHGSNPNE